MKYRKKPVHVEAVQLTGVIKIQDWKPNQAYEAGDPDAGWVLGNKSDWLLTFEDGHQELMGDREFREQFEAAPVMNLPHSGIPGARGITYPPGTVLTRHEASYPTDPVTGAPIVTCQSTG